MPYKDPEKKREYDRKRHRERGHADYLKNADKYREYARKYYYDNKEKMNEYSREYFVNNKEQISQQSRAYRMNVKQLVVDGYGGCCNCCGENQLEFLTIDHVYGGGNIHRSESNLSGGVTTYNWLIRNNFPKDFQVLCWNCNCARAHFGGICPHEIAVKNMINEMVA